MKTDTTDLEITNYKNESFPVYTSGEIDAGYAYIALTEDGVVYADTHECIAGLADVVMKRMYAWRISRELSGGDINSLFKRISPLLETVLEGHSTEWNGHNRVGRLTEQACHANEMIEEICQLWEASHEGVLDAIEYVYSGTFDIYSDWPPSLTFEAFVQETVDYGIYAILGNLGDVLLNHAHTIFESDCQFGWEEQPLPEHVVASLLEEGYISEQEVRQYKDCAATVEE